MLAPKFLVVSIHGGTFYYGCFCHLDTPYNFGQKTLILAHCALLTFVTFMICQSPPTSVDLLLPFIYMTYVTSIDLHYLHWPHDLYWHSWPVSDLYLFHDWIDHCLPLWPITSIDFHWYSWLQMASPDSLIDIYDLHWPLFVSWHLLTFITPFDLHNLHWLQLTLSHSLTFITSIDLCNLITSIDIHDFLHWPLLTFMTAMISNDPYILF